RALGVRVREYSDVPSRPVSVRVFPATTASVAGNTLTLTGRDGTSLYSRTLTPSARYGSGVVFSTTGDLYVLADSGVSRIVVANGVATESAASTAELPADIGALL
ncbi:hypothetical protein HQ306_18135, partial [Rhodococcus sp. BP-160]|uniref:hypothetical protein n=1 Tax=Rhodococcus sp. BP-160 TaxID=2739439 RepID=UPI001C9A455F